MDKFDQARPEKERISIDSETLILGAYGPTPRLGQERRNVMASSYPHRKKESGKLPGSHLVDIVINSAC